MLIFTCMLYAVGMPEWLAPVRYVGSIPTYESSFEVSGESSEGLRSTDRPDQHLTFGWEWFFGLFVRLVESCLCGWLSPVWFIWINSKWLHTYSKIQISKNNSKHNSSSTATLWTQQRVSFFALPMGCINYIYIYTPCINHICKLADRRVYQRRQ